jgi:hypothetical protein
MLAFADHLGNRRYFSAYDPTPYRPPFTQIACAGGVAAWQAGAIHSHVCRRATGRQIEYVRSNPSGLRNSTA